MSLLFTVRHRVGSTLSVCKDDRLESMSDKICLQSGFWHFQMSLQNSQGFSYSNRQAKGAKV